MDVVHYRGLGGGRRIRLLFGYVIGLEEEWGYFLSEIAGIRGPLGLAVERDLWFEPVPGRWDEKAGLQGRALRFPVSALKVQEKETESGKE